MGRGRNRWIGVTAAVLSAALVYGLYMLQRQQLVHQETVAVLAPKRFVAAGEKLERTDLEWIRMPAGAYSSDMVTELDAASGKETAIPLGRGEAIRDWKLNEHQLQPLSGQSTFQIPKDYVRSVSNGIRAGDRVLLYGSGEGNESRRVFGEPVVVASVKSSANVEVDGLEQSHLLSMAENNKDGMYAARRDANAMIEYVNLNLTEEQWLAIDRLCKDGSVKLVIAYSPESYGGVAAEEGLRNE
ncbi:SAF domain-containing protein [Paenibacillus soyae]|uniref:SAF domain-containing protein n=1 Tax=Paenibacillus soyae TaxID=2969249 RepID=A0A9X2S7R4_9BACL|nr:SAF domain-containing protein [Paenibacillus soyae]MCR2803346.1 SAF domain-containing protein [Paenibacillus soyae]